MHSSFSLATRCISLKVSFHLLNFLLLFEHPFTTQVRAIFTKYSTLYIIHFNFLYLQYLYYLQDIILFTFHITYIFLLLFQTQIHVKPIPLQARTSIRVWSRLILKKFARNIYGTKGNTYSLRTGTEIVNPRIGLNFHTC